jgi:hypothetical protein
MKLRWARSKDQTMTNDDTPRTQHTGRGAVGFLRQCLQHPAAGAVLLVLLILNASAVAIDRGSVVGDFVRQFDGRPRGSVYPAHGFVLFLRENKAVAEGENPWKAFENSMPPDAAVAEVWYNFQATTQGLWSHIIERRPCTLHVQSSLVNTGADPLLEDGVREQLLLAFVRHAGFDENSDQGKLLAQGGSVVTRVRWWAVLNDALVLLMFAGFAYAASWHAMRVWQWQKNRNGARRERAGLCAHCKYDKRGLCRCPECGK